MEKSSEKNTGLTFQKKVWITTSIVALVAVLILIFKTLFSVLLLLLAGALIAIYFRGLAGIIERYTKLSPKIALPVSIILSLLLLIGFFWFAGNRIQQQISELSDTLPSAIENFKDNLQGSTIGKKVLEKAASSETQDKVGTTFSQFFSSTFGVLGDIYIVLFIGIFFTVSPHTYTKGIIKLIPPDGKEKASEVIDQLGESLKKWLKGQLLAMLIVFVLTAIGLLILGVPMWLVLALIAGLLNFIPNFGPLIAMIPAVLVGLLQSTTTALLVAILYIVVQIIESNIVTPQIQKKLLNTPPALIIIAQLIMGVLTGGWGLVLATPLMVIMIVLVNELYVKKQKEM